MKRLITSIISIFIACFACFCTFDLYKKINAESNVINKYAYEDIYKDFNVLSIPLGSDIAFFNKDGKYVFEETFNKNVFDQAFDTGFNGTENKYNLIVNNNPCSITSSSYGSLYGYFELNYYDHNNNILASTPLDIFYTFYVDKLEVKIETNISEASYAYLQKYIERYGITLSLLTQVYDNDYSNTLEKVFVKYNINGDITTTSIAYGSSLLPPTPPTVEGKTFKGWSDGSGLVDLNTYKALSNVTLTAVYETNTYTVTFKNGSETISTQTVEYGNNATAPTVTPAVGYTFAGWDKALENITEDTTINATFDKIQYTIHYYDDVEKLLETKTYVIGDSISYTPPELTGYTFKSWNEDHYAFYSEYDINLDTLTAGFISNHFVYSTELYVYARYEINNYTVTYEDTNLTVRESSSDGYKLSRGNSVQYNSKIYISVTSKENYTFVIKVNGIETSNNSLVTITENTTITVEWTYVAPAKSWKTIYSGSKDCICSTYIEGLKSGCDFRITLASVKGNEWGTDVSYPFYSLVVSDSSQITLFSSYGDCVYASFSITKDNYLTINFSSDDDDLYAYSVNISLIEQYC